MPPGRPSNRDNGHDASHGNDKHSNKKTGGSGQSSKPTVAQQHYLKDLIAKHVTNNHPDKDPKTHPLDFESYSDEFLRKYKDKYKLPIQSDSMSLQGFLLGSDLGAKTESWKKINKGLLPELPVKENKEAVSAVITDGENESKRNTPEEPMHPLPDQIISGKRVGKKTLSREVKKHFQAHSVKENECIPQFIYKIKNDNKKFKMEF